MVAKQRRSNEDGLVAQEVGAACCILGEQLLSQLLKARPVNAWRHCIPDLQQSTSIGNSIGTGLKPII